MKQTHLKVEETLQSKSYLVISGFESVRSFAYKCNKILHKEIRIRQLPHQICEKSL